ncbi:hypothetical protein SLA2020_330690 [Shorea laevis]
MDNGSSLILHNVIRLPVNTFIGPSRSSSVPINLPSPARVASVNNQFNLREPNHTLMIIYPKAFHPTPQALFYMVSSFVSQMADGLDNRSIHRVSTNGHLIEPNGGVFGSSGSGTNLLHGNHYAWNNTNSHQQRPSSARIWLNSPSFVNGL